MRIKQVVTLGVTIIALSVPLLWNAPTHQRRGRLTPHFTADQLVEGVLGGGPAKRAVRGDDDPVRLTLADSLLAHRIAMRTVSNDHFPTDFAERMQSGDPTKVLSAMADAIPALAATAKEEDPTLGTRPDDSQTQGPANYANIAPSAFIADSLLNPPQLAYNYNQLLSVEQVLYLYRDVAIDVSIAIYLAEIYDAALVFHQVISPASKTQDPIVGEQRLRETANRLAVT